MKDVPEIAPELRGLLEEIVADPRSSIRLAPRRALLQWFGGGEVARASEVSATRAEHHLIEAHRESLADLLCEGARIAFWKAPMMAPMPHGQDGRPRNPCDEEPIWRTLAEHRQRVSQPGVDILRRCMNGIRPEDGVPLAKASLSLVAADRTRGYLALNLPWTSARTAIAVLSRVQRNPRPPRLRPDILRSLGARLCAVNRFQEARHSYMQAASLEPSSSFDAVYIFNLSCLLSERAPAIAASGALSESILPRDPLLMEHHGILRRFWGTRTAQERERVQNFASSIKLDLSEPASVLSTAFLP